MYTTEKKIFMPPLFNPKKVLLTNQIRVISKTRADFLILYCKVASIAVLGMCNRNAMVFPHT